MGMRNNAIISCWILTESVQYFNVDLDKIWIKNFVSGFSGSFGFGSLSSLSILSLSFVFLNSFMYFLCRTVLNLFWSLRSLLCRAN